MVEYKFVAVWLMFVAQCKNKFIFIKFKALISQPWLRCKRAVSGKKSVRDSVAGLRIMMTPKPNT
jgi:hypothetical protein